jgi:hypothetical protein
MQQQIPLPADKVREALARISDWRSRNFVSEVLRLLGR